MTLYHYDTMSCHIISLLMVMSLCHYVTMLQCDIVTHHDTSLAHTDIMTHHDIVTLIWSSLRDPWQVGTIQVLLLAVNLCVSVRVCTCAYNNGGVCVGGGGCMCIVEEQVRVINCT